MDHLKLSERSPRILARPKVAMLGCAATLALGAALGSYGSAHATTTLSPLYVGGATLSERVYRNIFNAFGSTATGDLCVGVTGCSSTPFNPNVEVLYAGVGSTNGIKAYDADSPALLIAGAKTPDNPPVASTRDFGPFYGTGTGSSWKPSSTSTAYFPKLSMASADGILSTDASAVTALGFGAPIQIPSLITSAAIIFTPTPGWNPKNKVLVTGYSAVNLSTNTLCGIWTGAITDWSNAEITKDNKGKQLGSGTITPVYRNDGSAITFLLGNALLNQCGTTTHPVSTHPVPDQWLADQSPVIPNSPPYTANNSFFINVFGKGHLPSNFYNNATFAGVAGGAKTNLGVQLATDATVGAIGYVSTDFAQPVVTGNDAKGNPVPAAANLQTYLSYSTGATPVYQAPRASTAYAILQTATPPSFSGSPAPALNALNWNVVNPTPTNKNAYPIGGFTYFLLYSCYASATDVASHVGPSGLLTWWYGSSTLNSGIPDATMTAEGYSPIPNAWTVAVNKLLANKLTKISTPGTKNTACATVSKGA